MRKNLQDTLRLGRAVQLVWKSGPGWTVANVVLIVVQGILPLLALYLTKQIVDAVVTGLAAPDKAMAFGHVALLITIAGGVGLAGAIARALSSYVSEGQKQVVTDYMNNIVHAKSVEVDLEYYENSQYYDTFHRAQQEATYRPTSIVNGIFQVGQSLFSFVAIVGLLFTLSWSVTLILLVAAIPSVLVHLRYANRMFGWQRSRTLPERQAGYFGWMLTGEYHAKEIRLFDLGPLFIRRYNEIRKQLRGERLSIALRRNLLDGLAQIGEILTVYGAYAFLAYRTLHGFLTIGDLVMYYQAFQRGQDTFMSVLLGFASLYEDNLFLSNLYDFLDLKRRVEEPHHPKPLPRPMQTGIVFDHVRFQYPTGTRPVLEDVSLKIRPGEVVALVGENGSGKTSLIKLLCRLYDPTEGRITLDGSDLRDFETVALRREISVIFQDYVHYQMTAEENIWLGKSESPPDPERIRAAAQQAGADAVIAGLPKGYETLLGKWFEEGEELSIGQWQKVALARAFLRDAQLIVLDEPTSAMDARAEYEVFQKFRELLEGRAAILISHRMSTVRMADTIYVLEHGKIIESGSHADLLRLNGTYAHLFETQAKNYR
ncbi:MAG TPA: ABC transporter ATP-binding protein [Chthonomonadaceae bacterium]|nr:ABC transporter ATP-binding protein [Chthonomonadaceae bacterium]